MNDDRTATLFVVALLAFSLAVVGWVCNESARCDRSVCPAGQEPTYRLGKCLCLTVAKERP